MSFSLISLDSNTVSTKGPLVTFKLVYGNSENPSPIAKKLFTIEALSDSGYESE